MKNEYQPLGGVIKDLAWSGDNQRIVVVGEGREKYACLFLFTNTVIGIIIIIIVLSAMNSNFLENLFLVYVIFIEAVILMIDIVFVILELSQTMISP